MFDLLTSFSSNFKSDGDVYTAAVNDTTNADKCIGRKTEKYGSRLFEISK